MKHIRGRANFFLVWGLQATLFFSVITTPLFAQSNIVINGSFEAVDSGWNWSSALGIMPNNYQAYDGLAWVEPQAAIWQDLSTGPNRSYYLRFATKNNSRVRVGWAENPPVDIQTANGNILSSAWVVTNLIFTATSTVTRLQFETNPNPFRLDAVEVLWLEEPVTLATPIASRSSFAGGAVTFSANAIGGPPLRYQWLHYAAPLLFQTNRNLTLTNLSSADSGQYSVWITNQFHSMTSAPADLVIHPLPNPPLIVTQPKPRIAIEGYAVKFYVVVVSQETLSYRWYRDNNEITGATNSSYELPTVTSGDAGIYSVVVSNHFGTARSIEAELQVLPPGTTGGWVNFGNRQVGVVDSPIFDTDQTTLLAGTNYAAQLYAGVTPNSLQPVGAVVAFRTGILTGYFTPSTRVIPNVIAGNLAYVQVRAWDYQAGKTYEEAQSRGGRFGKSKITSVTVTAPPTVPQVIGFKSFSLEAGRSPLATAKFDRGEQLPDGSRTWQLIGDAGYTYVVESRTPPNDWAPILILTNATGTVSFVDTNAQNASLKFYRAQIIEP